MKKLIHFVILVYLSVQQNELQLSHQPEATSSLGILIRVSSSSSLDKLTAYLDNLSSPTCEIVKEFNILWSNIKQGDNVQILMDHLSNYTKITTINIYSVDISESNFKFRIPDGSKADIYYVSDFNFNESCKDITQYYMYAQKYALAGLIPLIGEDNMISTIKADLAAKVGQFKYERVIAHKHYTFVQNIRLISKHFLELSQSNLREISLMGNLMDPSCQQIYINFIVAHFYPQLRPRYMKFNNQMGYYNDIPQKKSICIQHFIQILGYCPMFYQLKEWKKTIWINPNEIKIVQLKKKEIGRVILHQTRNLQTIKSFASFSTLFQNTLPQVETALSQQINLEEMIILALLSCIIVIFICLRVISSKVKQIQRQLSRTALPSKLRTDYSQF